EQEKLNLTDEQKKKVESLASAYEKEQRESFEKLREVMEKARQGGDQGARRQATETLREAMQARQKATEDAETKLKEVLTDEQKKRFEDIKRDRPRGFGGFGGFGGGGGLGGGLGGGFAPVTPGQVLPAALQDRLELTKEQKEKVEKLQKEVDE